MEENQQENQENLQQMQENLQQMEENLQYMEENLEQMQENQQENAHEEQQQVKENSQQNTLEDSNYYFLEKYIDTIKQPEFQNEINRNQDLNPQLKLPYIAPRPITPDQTSSKTKNTNILSVIKNIFTHYVKKNQKLLSSQQKDQLDLQNYCLFMKEFELNNLMDRINIIKIYKKSLNKNNEMQQEEFVGSFQLIAKESFNNQMDDLYSYMQLQDKGFLKKMGIPSFIKNINAIYQQSPSVEPKLRKINPSSEQEMISRLYKKEPIEKNKRSESDYKIPLIKQAKVNMVDWTQLTGNGENQFDKDQKIFHDLIGDNENEEDLPYLKDYKININISPAVPPRGKTKSNQDGYSAYNRYKSMKSINQVGPVKIFQSPQKIGILKRAQEIEKQENEKNQRQIQQQFSNVKKNNIF